MNCVVISAGSNIEPEVNIQQARIILNEQVKLIKQSTVLRTKPIGYTDQPDFLNCAFLIETTLDQQDLNLFLKHIEKTLGRIKTANKNGPRTIDLDILIWNGTIVDNDYYTRDFLKKSVRELIPSFHE